MYYDNRNKTFCHFQNYHKRYIIYLGLGNRGICAKNVTAFFLQEVAISITRIPLTQLHLNMYNQISAILVVFAHYTLREL